LVKQRNDDNLRFVGRKPFIPSHLTKRPFSLEEARKAGVTLSGLRGKAWRRLGAELYCWSGLREDPLLVLTAWRRVLPPESVFAGATAAWLLGLDMSPIDPIEIVLPVGSGVRSRAGLSVRHCEISRNDISTLRGFRATTLHRTLIDLCVRLPPVEALVAIDMSVATGLTDSAALLRYAKASNGRAGARRLRSLAVLAARAESPMETRLRWLLIQAGLPHPQVQTDLRDSSEQFIGRADLYYPSARLVLEYDGGNHRERLVEDRRQNLLIQCRLSPNAGFRLLRFTSADVHRQPDIVVAQVHAALTPASDNAHLAQNARNPGRSNARVDPNARNWWRRTLRGGAGPRL
jgi:very-short-patch-repair endonuclease